MIPDLPVNREAEAIVLSAMAWQGAAADNALALLDATDFGHDPHRKMFTAARQLRDKQIDITSSNLIVQLRETDQLINVGGVAGVSAVLDGYPSTSNVEAHAAVVRNGARLRRLIEEGYRIVREAAAGQVDADEFIDRAEQRIFAASADRRVGQARWLGELVNEEAARLDRVRSGNALPDGVPYGLVGLDALTHGMRAGEVTVVAGRPGAGKTALGLNIAINAARARTDGIVHGVFFASLEMSSRQIVRRYIASQSRVEYWKIERNRESAEELERFGGAVGDAALLPIQIDETTRMQPAQLRAQVRRMQSTFNKTRGPSGMEQRLSVVVVDYLQRMGCDTRRKDRFAEVAETMNAVADAAKELGVHFVVLAQLNREGVKTQGTAKPRRPRMNELAESGEIEKAAHCICLLHRPEYYEQDKDNVPMDIKGLAELVIDKQREGATGIVQLAYDAESTLFRDPTEGEVMRWAGQRPSGHAAGCKCSGCRS